MKEKRFIVFKVSTLLAFGLTIIMGIYLCYKDFSHKQILHYPSTLAIIILTFSISILFQVFNIRIADFLDKDRMPKLYFIVVHVILLALNVINIIRITLILYGLIFDFINKSVDPKPSPYLLCIYLLWIITNLITIISSLCLRNHLQKKHDYKEQQLLANIGKP